MTAQKKGEKWYVKRKDGTLGTRGYATQQKALNAQRNARALGKGKGSRKSSKGSSKGSTSAGGGSTSVTRYVKEKWGTLWRKFRTMLNVSAPALNPYHYAYRGMSGEWKMQKLISNYTSYNLGSGTVDFNAAVPTYQGIAVSMINDWFDRRTRKSAKISRGKAIHVITEAIPAIRAHYDARFSPEYAWDFVNSYNKYTTGYSIRHHNWDIDRVKEYAILKIGAMVWDEVVPQSFKAGINRAFPKGINPA